MKALVIVPAYNEEEALPQTLAGLQALPEGFDIVVVNDGSNDRTREVAGKLCGLGKVPIVVLNLPCNLGIGGAVQAGYQYAAQRDIYEYVIQFDGDGQHDVGSLIALVEECQRQELDLCVGSRFLTPGSGGFQSTAIRRLGIRFFARLISALTGVRVTDPTSGLRCCGPRAWRQFASRYPDDYPEPETIFWCARHGLRVGEVAVTMRPRQGGISSIRAARSLYYMVKVSLAILVERLRPREGVRR